MTTTTATLAHAEPDDAGISISRTISTLVEPGSIVELRAMETRRGTASGYYGDYARLTADAKALSGRAPAVYVTLNPVLPALLARSANHIKDYAKTTTGDAEIVARRWILLDCDPERPAGISSTDPEHELALLRARDVRDWLITLGISPASLVLADSGNGGHVLVCVDLPNDVEAKTLVERCLQAVNAHYGGEGVMVDQGVFNAARITKLYGTLTCKGDNMPDRPHRYSRLLDVPTAIEPTDLPALERLAALAPSDIWKPIGGGKKVDIDAWIEQHRDRLHILPAKEYNGGRRWAFEVCPWNPAHTNPRAAAIIQHQSGGLWAGCYHNGCAGKGWKELKALAEPVPLAEHDAPAPEPATESAPVPLPDLLHAIETFLRRYVFLASNHQATAIVLWIAHTHALDAAEATPYLSVRSPDKESGKSRLFEVLSLLVARPWPIISPTEAVLFRQIATKPTLLLDEIDTVFSDRTNTHEPVRALLNAGYRRGVTVARCVGDTQEVKQFQTFCAKGFAGIGDLPDTVASRSIPIRLIRKMKTDHVEPFRIRVATAQAKPITEMLSRWSKGAVAALREMYPDPIDGIGDRTQEVWDPLLAIADMAGGAWPRRARDAVVALHAPSALIQKTRQIGLLAGVRIVFKKSQASTLFTSVLVTRLMDEYYVDAWARSIAELDYRGAGHGLADALRLWEISPKTVRIGEKTAKGYDLKDLQPVFDRWLPALTDDENTEIAETIALVAKKEEQQS